MLSTKDAACCCGCPQATLRDARSGRFNQPGDLFYLLSSMVVGRSVATVAELCFMGQCAVLLHRAGSDTGNRFAVTVSLLLVPLIVVAEGASW